MAEEICLSALPAKLQKLFRLKFPELYDYGYRLAVALLMTRGPAHRIGHPVRCTTGLRLASESPIIL